MSGPIYTPARPPMEDALLTLSDAQKSAISTLAQCDDEEARRSVEHWIRAWDRALGRTDTIGLDRRIRAAKELWEPYIFEGGSGI